MFWFTGSRAHTLAVRRLAEARGAKLTPEGVFDFGKKVAGQTEESVYEAAGLPWIPPELREDRGEIEAALAGRLPELVRLDDLKGDLHVHLPEGPPESLVRAYAAEARAKGLEYLAVVGDGDCDIPGISLLRAIEAEVLADGTLDASYESLARYDLVIATVRSHFDLPRAQQTERLLRAVDHPLVTILAHPMGRLIHRRNPMHFDLELVLRHARARGCILELNARPDRMDLLDTVCRKAKREGVLVSIASGALVPRELDYLRFGVGQARRGWLEPENVVNTRPLSELMNLIDHRLSSV